MNELDQFIKHKLKIKYYLRYTDDFIMVHKNRQYLEFLIPVVKDFLKNKLKLDLHPNKIILRKLSQGADFLGYVLLPYHGVLRTKTKRRIFKKLEKRTDEYKSGKISKITLKNSLNSYLGVLSHADAFKLEQELKNQFWFWLKQ